jgi:GNAT superfamily N-acetyltransferase
VARLLATAHAFVDADHWHLDTVVTVPEAQGRGVGGTLVRHGLGLARDSGSAAYLEATGPDNARLYQRLGFDAAPPVRISPQVLLRPMVLPR